MDRVSREFDGKIENIEEIIINWVFSGPKDSATYSFLNESLTTIRIIFNKVCMYKKQKNDIT